MKQSKIFLNGEGADWLRRNREKLPPKNDPVITMIDALNLLNRKDMSVLEIGCSNGWRVKKIKETYGCFSAGVDPCLNETDSINMDIFRGTADNLPFGNPPHSLRFDIIIYGFCLYLCDREDLAKIVYEGDRVLHSDGYIIIHDFYPDYPHSRKYKHKEGVISYKQDYAKMWLGLGSYAMVTRKEIGTADGRTAVTVIKKYYKESCWPLIEERKPTNG